MATAASALRRLYLSAYNWAVFYGWAQVLYYAVSALLGSGHGAVYAAVERPLQLAQTAAVMEILHGLVGLVSEKYFLKMPNKWNFSFDYFYASTIAIGVYVPGGPHMFTYMLAQRKKALSKAKTA